METERKPRRWLRIPAAALIAMLTAFAVWPASVSARLQWRGGDAGAVIEPASTLPSEFPLRVEIELERPMHVYVASHDTVRGTIAMMPSTMLRSDIGVNPLPAGHHTLPGSLDGTALRWHAGDGVGATTIMVIASERPLPELASLLRRCRQMGNAAFPKRPVLGTYAPDAGMSAVPPLREVPLPLLRACHDILDPLHDGPMLPLPGYEGIYAKVLRVNTEPRGPVGELDAARASLQEKLTPLGGAVEPAAPSGR